MKLEKVTREKYDHISTLIPNTFLQKSYWGDVKKETGEYESFYYSIQVGNNVTGAFQVLVKKLNFFFLSKSIAYIPRARVVADINISLQNGFFNELITLLKNEFLLTVLEFDVPFPLEKQSSEDFSSGISVLAARLGVIEALNKEIQPKYTVLKNLDYADVNQSIESSNARRNLKRGLKFFEEQGFIFETKDKLDEKELIYAADLMRSVALERGFVTRGFKYLEVLQRNTKTQWFIIKDKDGKIVVANIGLIENFTYYDLLIGKVSTFDRQYISYVLKAKSFDYLKSQGFKYYDHGGAEINPESPKYGFTVFKMHFGGEIITYPNLLLISNLPGFIVRFLASRI